MVGPPKACSHTHTLQQQHQHHLLYWKLDDSFFTTNHRQPLHHYKITGKTPKKYILLTDKANMQRNRGLGKVYGEHREWLQSHGLLCFWIPFFLFFSPFIS
jgi:hypothetical protein